MQAKRSKILVLLESMIIFAGVLFLIFGYQTSEERTEVYRRSSEDGAHTLIICEIGEPDWPFGAAHYEISGPANFYVDVFDDGGHGHFDVKWQEDAVVITFSGKEQADAIFELPF